MSLATSSKSDEEITVEMVWTEVKQARFLTHTVLARITTAFYEVAGQTCHKMLLTANLKSGLRGEYLRDTLYTATTKSLRQFRYVKSLKAGWQRLLRLCLFCLLPKPEMTC